MNEKPIILAIEEAKSDLETAVNEILKKHQIPFYFLEPIFADLYKQVAQGKAKELEAARAKVAERSED